MNSFQHSRARTSFEVLCALALAGSFAAAWDQTGASALLVSASLVALLGLSRAAGLFGGGVETVARPAVVETADAPEEDAPRIEIYPFEPEALPEPVPLEPEPAALEPEPVALEPAEAPKPKRRSKKARVDRAAVEQPVALADPETHEPAHIEQLFDPQPFVRQHRPAFGRRSRGPLPAA